MNKSQYIEDFTSRCYELSKTKLDDAPSKESMTQQVNDMIEEYYKIIGKMPKAIALEYLANYLLVNELKSKAVDKVSNTEFPILSDVQIKRRARKQTPMQEGTLDFLNTKFHKHIDSLSRKAIPKVEY